MKIFKIPDKVEGLIFDIDLTLYESPEYAHAQIDLLIKRAASELNQDYLAFKAAIEVWQRNYADTHQQEKPSLGNTFVAFGIPIKQSVQWREELLKPEDYLSPDLRLQETLKELAGFYKLIAVTNNPSQIGVKTLAALGVAAFFQTVIGLDVSGVSKPHQKPFYLAQQALNLPYENIISIGDRYDVDLSVPLKLGMGGILIENINDVHSLPRVLRSTS